MTVKPWQIDLNESVFLKVARPNILHPLARRQFWKALATPLGSGVHTANRSPPKLRPNFASTGFWPSCSVLLVFPSSSVYWGCVPCARGRAR